MLAAVYDFPRFKSIEDRQTAARAVATTLRQEVCCTGGDNEGTYQQLILSAYVNFYKDAERESEREMTVWASDVKRVAPSEAQVYARSILAQGKGQEELDRAYAQFLEATNG